MVVVRRQRQEMSESSSRLSVDSRMGIRKVSSTSIIKRSLSFSRTPSIDYRKMSTGGGAGQARTDSTSSGYNGKRLSIIDQVTPSHI